jgi:hypothetical protein
MKVASPRCKGVKMGGAEVKSGTMKGSEMGRLKTLARSATFYFAEGTCDQKKS